MSNSFIRRLFGKQLPRAGYCSAQLTQTLRVHTHGEGIRSYTVSPDNEPPSRTSVVVTIVATGAVASVLLPLACVVAVAAAVLGAAVLLRSYRVSEESLVVTAGTGVRLITRYADMVSE